MWIKGTPLHLIVDNNSENNLILTEFIRRLNLMTKPYPQLYTIGWLRKEPYLCVIQEYNLSYDINPFNDEVLCDVSAL